MSYNIKNYPNKNGYFGEYGGVFVPPPLEPVLQEIKETYLKIKDEKSFQDELSFLYRH